jgi:peptidoglycan/LPS O-acetylase OafA/YrhL
MKAIAMFLPCNVIQDPAGLLPAGSVEVTVKQAKARPGARLAFVDGLRGLAILMVLLRHFYMGIYTPSLPRWADFMGLGYLGVHLFLVLSGFCVAWAFVGPRPREMNLREFAFRRASRILPAYYAALILFTLLALPMSPAQLVRQLLTHLTMTHNLAPDTTLALNGAFWSLALECQLYITFPLLLEGYRRIGPALTLAGVFCVEISYRILVARHFGTQGLEAETFPWAVFGRVSEFALGVYAAILVGRSAGVPFRRRWQQAFPALTCLCFAVGVGAKHRLGMTAPLTDVAWSLGFFWLLLAGSVAERSLGRALSWQPLVALGVISYSVYLVHGLIIGSLCHWMRPHLSASQMLFFGVVPVLAAAIALSYGFYRLFEKPSLDYFARKRKAAPRAAR